MMVMNVLLVLCYTIHAALPLPATTFAVVVERVVWMVFVRVMFVKP